MYPGGVRGVDPGGVPRAKGVVYTVRTLRFAVLGNDGLETVALTLVTG